MNARAFVLGATLAMLCSTAAALTYVMPDDRTLLQQSDGVLVGTVTGVPVAGRSGALPHVRYGLIVERVLKGQWNRAEAFVDLPGSLPGAKLNAFIPGIPKLSDGQRLLIFFDKRGKNSIVPEQLTLGLFFESRAKTGERAYVRYLDDARPIKSAAMSRYFRKRDAGKFEQWIRLGRLGKLQEGDYFVPVEAESKFNLAPGPFGDGLFVRWFQFDSSTSVPWSAVAAGMVGATFDVFAAASNALAAWSNDAASRILYTYQGTVASDSGNDGTNGINAFIWDDPGADIPGVHNCVSGVLALGGAFSSSNTGVYNGISYHRTVEAFVITQNGASCVFNGNGGLDGAEILAHEVGHTLGFGHSCEGPACDPGSVLDSAVMRSFVHRDGRGAALGADDQAAATFLYEDASAPIGRIFVSGFEG